MGKIEGRDMKTIVYPVFGKLGDGGCLIKIKLLQTFTTVKNEEDYIKLVSS